MAVAHRESQRPVILGMDIGRRKRPNGFRAFQSQLRSEGAVPVEPAAFMEAVTRHALGEQKKGDYQDDDDQEIRKSSELGWFSTCRRGDIRISRHQGASPQYQATAN
jgi:hypothetical protein